MRNLEENRARVLEVRKNLLANWGRGKRFEPEVRLNVPKAPAKIKPKRRKQELINYATCNPFFSPPPKPQKPFEGPRGFGQALEKRGFKALGAGAYSTVYAKEGQDRVIKVTRTQDGWIDYCVWAAKHGYAGKFAPKVYSYKEIKAENPFWVAVVERMDVTLSHLDYANDNKPIGPLLDYAVHGNPMSKDLLDCLHNGLGQFATDLGEEYECNGLDLHGGNVMTRKDGSVCVTDPVCRHGYQSSYKRLKSTDFAMAA